MGNKVSEGHNQLNNCLGNKVNDSHNKEENENEINLIVSSIVNDLIDSVLNEELIMSEEKSLSVNENERNCLESMLSPLNRNQTNDNMDESYSTPPSFNDISLQTKLNKTYTQTDPFSPQLVKQCEEEFTCGVTNDKNGLINESEYGPQITSPVSISSYSKLNRVSPISLIANPTEWKYSSHGKNTSDDSPKSDNIEFDTSLGLWNRKEPIKRNSSLNQPSRMSLYRQFDPLIGSEDNQYSKLVDKSSPRLNDSIDLVKKFEWLKINDSPGSANNSNGHYFNSPKPDVLAFAIEENNDQKKEQYQKYDEKLKEKDLLIDEIHDKLSASEKKNENLMKLIATLHSINEELVQTASQVLQKKDSEIEQLMGKCNSLTSEKCQAVEDVNGIEKSFTDLHLRYDKLRNDYSLSKENEKLYQKQYITATDRINELENVCKNLKSKVGAERDKCSENAKKEVENELIAVRAQYKKAEMKINSLQNQLDQKTQENTELSSMVDELILKVRK